MAIHSSILAWRIPWTEEPGGLQSRGSQKSRTWLSDCTTAKTACGNAHCFLCVQCEGSYSISIFRYPGRCRRCFILGPRSCSGTPAGCLGCISGAGLCQATGLLASKLKFPATGGRFRTGLEEESQVCACVCLLYTVFLHGGWKQDWGLQ